MKQHVLFYIAVLMILFAWYRMLRPSLLDAARDKLFALRDEVRDEFVKGPGLDHPVYKALRDTINSQLRYTNAVSLIGFVRMIYVHRTQPQMLEGWTRKRDRDLFCEDASLEAFVKDVRNRAAQAVLDFIAMSSLCGWFLAAIGMCVFGTRAVGNALTTTLSKFWLRGGVIAREVVEEVAAVNDTVSA